MNTFNNYLEIIQEQRYNFILNESEPNDIETINNIKKGYYDKNINEVIENPKLAYLFAVYRIENPWGSFNSIINSNVSYRGENAKKAVQTIENSKYNKLYNDFKQIKTPLYQSASGLTQAGEAFLAFWLMAFSLTGITVGGHLLTKKATEYNNIKKSVENVIKNSTPEDKIEIIGQLQEKIDNYELSRYNITDNAVIKAAEEIKNKNISEREKTSIFGDIWKKIKFKLFPTISN